MKFLNHLRRAEASAIISLLCVSAIFALVLALYHWQYGPSAPSQDEFHLAPIESMQGALAFALHIFPIIALVGFGPVTLLGAPAYAILVLLKCDRWPFVLLLGATVCAISICYPIFPIIHHPGWPGTACIMAVALLTHTLFSRRLIPLASLLYWLFIVALCIFFAEVTVRLWGLSPRYSLKAKGLDYALPFVLDEELLYRFLPEPERSINTQGFRDHEFPAKSPDKKRLVVLGDSFPMGLIVTPSDTFPKKLEQLLPNYEVLNLGVQGYGPDQELRLYSKIEATLQPDEVIWSLFPSNDYNDLIKNNLLHLESGELVATKPNPISQKMPLLHSPLLIRYLLSGHFLPPEEEASLHPMLFLDHESPRPVSAETIRLMHEILKSMQTRLKSSGVALSAVVIPSYEQAQLQAPVTHELNLRTVHILNELGVSTIDLSQAFRNHPEYYTEEDHHLSVTGHSAVAASIAAGRESSPAR